jgi:hypothetical protein
VSTPRMPSIRVIRPLRLEVHKTLFWPARVPTEMHTVVYDCGTGERFHTLVHVPPELLGELCSGKVRRFLLIKLKLNGDAMRALPDCPQYLIAGLTLNDGVIATALPPQFREVRQNLIDKARRVAAVAIAGTLLSPWALSLLLLAVKHWLEACAVPSLRWLDAIKEEDLPSGHPRYEVPCRRYWARVQRVCVHLRALRLPDKRLAEGTAGGAPTPDDKAVRSR